MCAVGAFGFCSNVLHHYHRCYLWYFWNEPDQSVSCFKCDVLLHCNQVWFLAFRSGTSQCMSIISFPWRCLPLWKAFCSDIKTFCLLYLVYQIPDCCPDLRLRGIQFYLRHCTYCCKTEGQIAHIHNFVEIFRVSFLS